MSFLKLLLFWCGHQRPPYSESLLSCIWLSLQCSMLSSFYWQLRLKAICNRVCWNGRCKCSGNERKEGFCLTRRSHSFFPGRAGPPCWHLSSRAGWNCKWWQHFLVDEFGGTDSFFPLLAPYLKVNQLALNHRAKKVDGPSWFSSGCALWFSEDCDKFWPRIPSLTLNCSLWHTFLTVLHVSACLYL